MHCTLAFWRKNKSLGIVGHDARKHLGAQHNSPPFLAEDEGSEGRSSVVSMHSECVMLDSSSGSVGLIMKPVYHEKKKKA